jgi:hypothetical protein
MRRTFLAVLLFGTLAQAQQVVFTMLTSPTCPVMAMAPEQSKDFGFQSVLFRNDSHKSIQAVYLTVTFYTTKSREREPEEVVDSSHIYIELGPGEEKRLDVFLGKIQALKQKLKSSGQQVAWAKLFVDSAEFSDGSRWSMNDAPKEPADTPVNAVK